MAEDVKLPPEWIEQIKEWAVSSPSVAAVYIYGSRARGSGRPYSDLDLAILVNASDGNHLSDWIENASRWRRELGKRLNRIEVHLKLGNVEAGPLVATAVARDGILIFARHGSHGGV